ncbi:hypothetical protein [Ralstonia sp. A12]|uniref:hypothetical protein n=1 Tax=Ralstonia sp. A12 TaxID=1217052 RepID=UPI0012ED3C3C|nr:hypothetical protein [Ralstonia sp. A12]
MSIERSTNMNSGEFHYVPTAEHGRAWRDYVDAWWLCQARVSSDSAAIWRAAYAYPAGQTPAKKTPALNSPLVDFASTLLRLFRVGR